MVQEDVRAVTALQLVAVAEAQRELSAARQWFEWVTDPGLVDEAILRLRAAEMRLARAYTPLREMRRRVRAGA